MQNNNDKVKTDPKKIKFIKKIPWGKISLLIFGFLLSFLIVRTLDFAFYRWYTHNLFFHAINPNTEVIFELARTKSENKISSQGLNNEEVKIPKPEKTLRILALGDSTTFGWGVNLENTWPKKLEKKINAEGNLPYKVEIINAGIPGSHPSQYPQVCDFYRNQFEIDLFLIAFFSNDLYDEGAISAEKIPFHRTLAKLFLPHIGALNNGQTQLLNLPSGSVNPYWQDEARSLTLQPPGLVAINRMSKETKDLFFAGKLNPSRVKIAVYDPNYYTTIETRKYAQIGAAGVNKAVAATIRSCGGQQNLLGFLTIPNMVLVSETWHEKSEGIGFNIPEDITSSVVSDNAFKDAVKDYGAPLWSALETFRKDGCPDCYFRFDGHLTVKGNIETSRFLSPQVLSRLKQVKPN